jgi:hypothetical protein
VKVLFFLSLPLLLSIGSVVPEKHGWHETAKTISETVKNYAETAGSIATTAALIIGGIWAYRNFFQFREGEPKIDLSIEVDFIRKHGARWIVEVEALLENKSKVRHEFRDFAFKVCYALQSDELNNEICHDAPIEGVTLRQRKKANAKKAFLSAARIPWAALGGLISSILSRNWPGPQTAHGDKVGSDRGDLIFETLAEDKTRVEKRITLSISFPHVAAEGSWLADAKDPADRFDFGALEPGERDRWSFITSVPEDATIVSAYSELYDERSKESHTASKIVSVPPEQPPELS